MTRLQANSRQRYPRLRTVPLLITISLGAGAAYLLTGLAGRSGDERAHDAQLSSEQRELVERFGQPDSFLIAFLDEEAEPGGGGRTRRMETWYYTKYRTTFSFVDGRFAASEAFEPMVIDPSAPLYRPEQFQQDMEWEEVRELLSINDYMFLNVDDLNLKTPEVPAGMKIYLARSLVLGFAEGRLAMVQSSPESQAMKFLQSDAPKGLFGNPK